MQSVIAKEYGKGMAAGLCDQSDLAREIDNSSFRSFWGLKDFGLTKQTAPLCLSKI